MEINSIFESIKRTNEYGFEFWSARELSKVLEYKEYRNFTLIIYKVMEACKNSGLDIIEHIGEATHMIHIGNGGKRQVDDYHLSRYACYLVVQNADPSKEVVALGQSYFAIQTRRQELNDELEQINDNELRLRLRAEMKQHNIKLADAAKDAGVQAGMDYAIFQNHGYMGLYGGLDAKDIHRIKSLNKNEKILDHMGSTELAANLFRATQAEDKLRREKIKGKQNANAAHLEVGKKVRQTIEELGGTMPEDLPTPTISIKKLENEKKKQIKE